MKDLAPLLKGGRLYGRVFDQILDYPVNTVHNFMYYLCALAISTSANPGTMMAKHGLTFSWNTVY